MDPERDAEMEYSVEIHLMPDEASAHGWTTNPGRLLEWEAVRSRNEVVMNMVSKNHSPAFKAKVDLRAAREQRTVAELGREYRVHVNQIRAWKCQLLDAAVDVFESGVDKRKNQEEVVKELHVVFLRCRGKVAAVRGMESMRSLIVDPRRRKGLRWGPNSSGPKQEP